ncbi:MAG: hypothetical protein VX705_03390 [Verrucomicrobiota bacterium]|nr:hypothetical protein [Verrucomicrobiota bacterium]
MKKLTSKSLVSTVAALFMGTLIMSGCGTTEEEAAPAKEDEKKEAAPAKEDEKEEAAPAKEDEK